jgi:surface antigen
MLRNPDETPSASNPNQRTALRERRRGVRWVRISLAAVGLAGLLASPSYAATSHVDGANAKKPAHVSAPANKPVAAAAKHPATRSGSPTSRLQATNASMAASLNQMKSTRGMTTAQRAANLRIVARTSSRSYGISCVPYARNVTGMMVSGNAWQWWNSSAGTYERGARPEAGSVLNFRSTGRMRLGHVAVVSRVVNKREIEIDHANWAGGGISRGVAVIDVSEANDWTAVRVGLGGTGSFGSVYPTYGFIYNRADHGVMIANAPDRVQPTLQFQQIAEAPAPRIARVNLDVGGR